eukprot:gene2862-3660_t
MQNIDIVHNYPELMDKLFPREEVIECLSIWFQILDDLAEDLGVYKVETVGDQYMAVCGAPVENPEHASRVAEFALRIMEVLPLMPDIFIDGADLTMRLGMHTGTVVGGVIRANRPRWQLFGDAVNLASRMESTSLASQLQVSASVYETLKDSDGFELNKRPMAIEIKGKGMMETYWLIRGTSSTPYLSDCVKLSDYLEVVRVRHSDSLRAQPSLPSLPSGPAMRDAKNRLRLCSIESLNLNDAHPQPEAEAEIEYSDFAPQEILSEDNLSSADAVNPTQDGDKLQSHPVTRQASKSKGAPRHQVLWVDSTVSTAMVYMRALRQEGVEVLICMCGALSMLRDALLSN